MGLIYQKLKQLVVCLVGCVRKYSVQSECLNLQACMAYCLAKLHEAALASISRRAKPILEKPPGAIKVLIPMSVLVED